MSLKSAMFDVSMVSGIVTLAAVQAGVCLAYAADAADLLSEAVAEFRQGNYTRAVDAASRAIERDGKSVEAYRLRAEAHEALGRFDQAIADLDRCLELQPEDAGAYQARGELHFKAGHIRASIADFDSFLTRYPERVPHHWQRGISYYYAGEYEKGVGQFDRHRSVNPQDVENAIWHYLCKARVDGADAARQALIDISRDRRPWAMEVYRLFQGKVTPDEALEHAERVSRSEAERKDNLFYTHLYVGLLHESAGRPDASRRHLETAVEKYLSPHYMGDVARVHLELRKAGDDK